MARYNRGGKNLSVGDIGRMKVLRQHLLLPGERLNASIQGNVKLSALRQQTSVYLHASIEAFASPLRHYWSDFPHYLQEGADTAKTIPISTVVPSTQSSGMGLGTLDSSVSKWFIQHPQNVWNEWYRHDDDSRVDVSAATQSFFAQNGKICVNLPSAITRLRTSGVFPMDRTVASTTSFDVRELAYRQAKFEQEALSSWSTGWSTGSGAPTESHRYKAFMKEILHSNVKNNEVDKVPIRLMKGANLKVKPFDQYASDGASLGEQMSISNFQVDHKWGDFMADEHMVVCYVMLLRFAPVTDSGVSPHAYPNDMNYYIHQGDPNVIANSIPTPVKSREVESGDGSVIGYLPAGWQHREGFHHVDDTIKNLNNFPLMNNSQHFPASYRDASNINSGEGGTPFRSLALRHYFCDLDFDLSVNSKIPQAGESIMSGGSGGPKPKGLHPNGGWQI